MPGLDADLPRVAQHFRNHDGCFWVAEVHGHIVGMIGYVPLGGGAVELKRLYVAPDMRRAGLATRLLSLVVECARSVDASRIDLWSDTRFKEAHAFYLKHGFSLQDQSRFLNDPSHTTEYLFRRELL